VHDYGMIPIGKVVAILDDRRLLLSIDIPVSVDVQVLVFERIPLEMSGIDLPNLDVPKGRISIVAQQENNFYLAERFREGTTRRKINLADVGIARLFGNEYEEVPGPWSVGFQKEQVLGIKASQAVSVGDLIARV
jgi:hypothetical protein